MRYQRLESIDLMRGLAICWMGTYHFMRRFIDESSLNQIMLYAITIPGRLAAPFFLILSGISAVMMYDNLRRGRGTADKGIFVITTKRGVFLIILSIFLNLLSYHFFQSGAIWEWNIFQLIGVSLILTVVLVKMGFLGTLMFVVLWQFSWFVIQKSGLEITAVMSGYFPMLPWLNYILLGMVIGHVIIYSAAKRPNSKLKFWCTALLFAITFALWLNFYKFDAILAHEQRPYFTSMILIFFMFVTFLIIAQTLIQFLGVYLTDIVKLGQIAVVVKKDVAFLHFKKAQDSFVIFTISALNPHKRLFAPTS